METSTRETAFSTGVLTTLAIVGVVRGTCLFFASNRQGEITPLYRISVYPVESPEWQGSLPIGQSADNYTISIAGKRLNYEKTALETLWNVPRTRFHEKPVALS